MGDLLMRNKIYLILVLIFSIAIIYDSAQIFEYGVRSCSGRFIATYILNVVALLAWLFLLIFTKKGKNP